MSSNTDRNERELASGLWPRVHARIRPLHDWERAADADPQEQRMVEFYRHRTEMVEVADTDWYSPLRARDLLGEFMHLFGGEVEATDEKVIDFYARYGPLRERVQQKGASFPTWALRLETEAQEQLSTEARLLLCEPLWWLRERARELRLTYDLYRALKEDRLSFVRTLIGGIPEGKRLIGVSILGGRVIREVTDDDGRKVGSFSIEYLPADEDAEADRKQQALRPLSDDECVGWGNDLLAYQLNIGEQRSARRWSRVIFTPGPARLGGPDGEPPTGASRLVRSRATRDLVGAMYLQLGELVEKDALMSQCEGCRRLFFPKRTDQRFCDSRCGDAARQRAYYAERKAGSGTFGRKGRPRKKSAGTQSR